MQVRSLLSRASQLSGLSTIEEGLPEELTDFALFLIKDLCDELRVESLWSWASKTYSFTTNQRSVTIGKDTALNHPDVATNQSVLLVDSLQYYLAGIWSPVAQISKADFMSMGVSDIAATIPTSFYYEQDQDANHFGVLYFTQPLNSPYTFRLTTRAMTDDLTLDTELQLPSGYEGVLAYGVAKRLANQSALESSHLEREFTERLGRIKAFNSKPKLLKMPNGNILYDIRMDTSGRTRSY